MKKAFKKVAIPFVIILIGSMALPIVKLAITNTQAQTNEKVFYYLQDHLRGIEAITDQEGNVVKRRDYLPYGSEKSSDSESWESYGYTGKEMDDETGLYYYGARYYDPVIGRFAQIDPLVLDESDKPLTSILENPQSLNSYSYVLNNPIKYIDENGEWSIFAHSIFTSKAISMNNVDDDWKKEHEEKIRWGASTYADIVFKGDPSYHSTTPSDITSATDLKNRMMENAKKLFESPSDLKFGKLLHMIQDSYCPSHVKRDKDGNIEAFYDYNQQDTTKHLKGDSIKYADLDTLTSVIEVTKKLVEYRTDPDTKWENVEEYLDKTVWTLSKDATVGTPGEEYEDD